MANREAASRSDVLQGTLDLMVLQTLAALGQSHGYAIADRIEQVSHLAIQLNMGTLYPALVRLGHHGFYPREMGYHGEQPARAFLSAHGRGPQTTKDRASRLGTHGGDHVPPSE